MNSFVLSLPYGPTLITIHDDSKNHSFAKLWRRQWHPTPLLLPGKSHGRRSLVGCSLWGRYELDTTKRLDFHFSLSCIGQAMTSHSSVLAWRIPGMGEPGGLPSMGPHRVRHNWSDLAAAAAAPFYWGPLGLYIRFLIIFPEFLKIS